jgi:hypothetical protein
MGVFYETHTASSLLLLLILAVLSHKTRVFTQPREWLCGPLRRNFFTQPEIRLSGLVRATFNVNEANLLKPDT